MRRKGVACFLAASFCCALSIMPANAASIESEPGLRAANFLTTKGFVQVNFPDNFGPGETISGTILTEPKGSSTSLLAKAEQELGTYTVVLNGQEVKVSEGEFLYKIPSDAKEITLELKGKTGHALGKAQTVQFPAVPTNVNYDFQTRAVSQAGRTMEIFGKFDGRFGTTNVLINGKHVDLLAESPRKVVVSIPADARGLVDVQLSEQDKTMSASCPVLAIQMTQPDSFIQKNKEITVTINIAGASGLKEPVELVLENFSAGVVELSGGDTQRIPIAYNQFDNTQLARNLKGLKVGTVRVVASLDTTKFVPFHQ